MSTPDAVSMQQKLMARWPGRPIDPHGILRVLNEDGERPPLLWVFNEANEPEKLARSLGAEQPLVFSRSTHLMAGPDRSALPMRRQLAQHLVELVAQFFPNAQMDIGTSCQGSGLVMQFAASAPQMGLDIGHLCIINCSLVREATNRPALLIYGSDDKKQDPFERDFSDATSRADALFSSYRRLVVTASHGTYYEPAVIAPILEAFNQLRSAPSDSTLSSSPASSSTVG